jgi:hypothetical protein
VIDSSAETPPWALFTGLITVVVVVLFIFLPPFINSYLKRMTELLEKRREEERRSRIRETAERMGLDPDKLENALLRKHH